MADEVLERVRTELKESLTKTVIKQLLDDLNDEKVLGDEEVESLLQRNTDRASQARDLIDSVKKKGHNASLILTEKLRRRDKNVYDKLKLGELLPPQTPDSSTRGPPPKGPPANISSGKKPSSHDEEECVTVLPGAPGLVPEYTMKSKPRGVCVIINNENFTNPEDTRKGSTKDADALEDVFKFLGFKVEMHKDLSAKEMKDLLLEYGRGQPRGDCWVCCVLSHGDSKGVFGCDWKPCPTEDIFSPFDGKNCPSLLGKPKLFFIQACRGSKVQEKLLASDQPVVSDAGIEYYSIPQDSDFLIARATVYGYLSFRSPEGSWFIQSLCAHLKEGNKTGDDILTVLTRVNDEVSRKEGKGKDKKTGQFYDAKETPSSSFTLRKKLIFRCP